VGWVIGNPDGDFGRRPHPVAGFVGDSTSPRWGELNALRLLRDLSPVVRSRRPYERPSEGLRRLREKREGTRATQGGVTRAAKDGEEHRSPPSQERRYWWIVTVLPVPPWTFEMKLAEAVWV
jgi:hypothetical protein